MSGVREWWCACWALLPRARMRAHALSLLTVRGARLHTQEFNKTGSTLIFHLTNHYALIYGLLML